MDNDSQNPTQQPTGGMTVMDIQAPQTSAPAVSQSTTTDAQNGLSANDPFAPEAPTTDQVPPTDTTPTGPTDAGTPDNSSADTPAPTVQNPMAATKPAKKRTGLVIIVAVVVALALAVAAYFALQKNSSKPQSAAKSTTTAAATAAPAAKAATASDVDQASQAVDKSLSGADDTKDFSSADLTDAALGL